MELLPEAASELAVPKEYTKAPWAENSPAYIAYRTEDSRYRAINPSLGYFGGLHRAESRRIVVIHLTTLRCFALRDGKQMHRPPR
jgi:hypothetical protein